MKRFAFLAIIWALGGIAIFAYNNWYDLSHGTIVKFNIRGFDPRDYLAGQYLTYNVEYGAEINCSSNNYELDDLTKDRCICLGINDVGLAKAKADGAYAKLEDCETIGKSCPLWLRGRCEHGSTFIADIERYYIPESEADINGSTPEGSAIIVSISKSGRGMVKGIELK
jgi:uncharacterized membrane-anchored protein